MSRRPPLLVPLIAALPAPTAARAIPDLPEFARPVTGNPADRLLGEPIEDTVCDPATRCVAKPKPGSARLVRRLTANAAARTSFWRTDG